MESFNLLPQASAVASLLNACLAMLPHAPEPEKAVLVSAMREFEMFSAPVLWSTADVETTGLDLTDEETRKVIERFVQSYACSEADWAAIHEHAEAVLAERP